MEQKMQKVNKTVRVVIPATQVWEIISDFQGVNRYHPLVEKVDQIGTKENDLAAIRVCNMYDKSSIKEEITHWIEGQALSLLKAAFPSNLPTRHYGSKLLVQNSLTSLL